MHCAARRLAVERRVARPAVADDRAARATLEPSVPTELHDALVWTGAPAPPNPSLMEYFKALHSRYGEASTVFAPQNAKTHRKY